MPAQSPMTITIKKVKNGVRRRFKKISSRIRQTINPEFEGDIWDSSEDKKYLVTISNVLKNCSDQSLLSAMHDIGPMYKGMNVQNKALTDIGAHGLRYLAICHMLPSLLQPIAGRTLEVGCNTGFLSFFLKDRFPNLDVVAIDKYAKTIAANELIKRVLNIDVTFEQILGEHLLGRYPGGYFDVILVCEILEHLEYKSPAQLDILANSAKLCRSGGRILITVPFKDRIPHPGHLTEFTEDMLSDLLLIYGTDLKIHHRERYRFGLDNHIIMSMAPPKDFAISKNE